MAWFGFGDIIDCYLNYFLQSKNWLSHQTQLQYIGSSVVKKYTFDLSN